VSSDTVEQTHTHALIDEVTKAKHSTLIMRERLHPFSVFNVSNPWRERHNVVFMLTTIFLVLAAQGESASISTLTFSASFLRQEKGAFVFYNGNECSSMQRHWKKASPLVLPPPSALSIFNAKGIKKETTQNQSKIEAKQRQLCLMHMVNDSADINAEKEEEGKMNETAKQERDRKRDKVRKMAKNIAKSAINVVNPKPRAIAAVLTDSAISTAEIAINTAESAVGQNFRANIRKSRAFRDRRGTTPAREAAEAIEEAAEMEAEALKAIDAISLARTAAADAFYAAETAIQKSERALSEARAALAIARSDASEAIAKAEENAATAAATARYAEELATVSATIMSSQSAATSFPSTSAATATNDTEAVDVEEAYSLSYEEVDYHLAEMAPPFIGEDQCLVPGEAVVRVEKAPENSRRIFAGIDMMAAVDDVWKVRIMCMMFLRFFWEKKKESFSKNLISSRCDLSHLFGGCLRKHVNENLIRSDVSCSISHVCLAPPPNIFNFLLHF